MGLFDMFTSKAANEIGKAVKQGVTSAVNNKKERLFLTVCLKATRSL